MEFLDGMALKYRIAGKPMDLASPKSRITEKAQRSFAKPS